MAYGAARTVSSAHVAPGGTATNVRCSEPGAKDRGPRVTVPTVPLEEGAGEGFEGPASAGEAVGPSGTCEGMHVGGRVACIAARPCGPVRVFELQRARQGGTRRDAETPWAR